MPQPSNVILRYFAFEPTKDQQGFFRLLDDFLSTKVTGRKVLMLKGYAGTGKTTLLSALVKVLPLFNFKSLLLAPTGRAAKIMSQYTGKSAFTIHKIMFKPSEDESTGSLVFKRQKNYSKDTIFIIDEASMLATTGEYGRKSLLEQVMDFVFEHESNRLLIIGDDAQLPPVGQERSLSLDPAYFASRFQLQIQSSQLQEVIRQQADSGILFNATKLRSYMNSQQATIGFEISRFGDVFRLTGERLEDGLKYAYDKYGIDQTMIICRSNKSAVQYNRFIRQQIFYYENELEAGDVLMIARNNYAYLDEQSKAGFLANGDFMEINRILRFEELHGFRFAHVEMSLLDYPEEPFEGRIFLDTLHAETPSMGKEDAQRLYQSVAADYADIASEKERLKTINADPYLNAIQVKYAYALTCHKSQGGQWKSVFVDQGFLKEEMVDINYMRWLYTAVTRASKELFLLNFHKSFFVS